MNQTHQEAHLEAVLHALKALSSAKQMNCEKQEEEDSQRQRFSPKMQGHDDDGQKMGVVTGSPLKKKGSVVKQKKESKPYKNKPLAALLDAAALSEEQVEDSKDRRSSKPREVFSDTKPLPRDGSEKSSPAKNKTGDRSATLQAKWDEMFNRLVAFREKHGHCLVPNRFAEDPQLGSWVSTQRRQYKLLASGSCESSPMTSDRAERLLNIGFEWSTKDPRHVPWQHRYNELKQFVQKHGHAQVPIGWEENVQLANWVSTQRQEYKLLIKGRSTRLTRQRIDLLNKVNFVWEAQRGGPRKVKKSSVCAPPPPTASQKSTQAKTKEEKTKMPPARVLHQIDLHAAKSGRTADSTTTQKPSPTISGQVAATEQSAGLSALSGSLQQRPESDAPSEAERLLAAINQMGSPVSPQNPTDLGFFLQHASGRQQERQPQMQSFWLPLATGVYQQQRDLSSMVAANLFPIVKQNQKDAALAALMSATQPSRQVSPGVLAALLSHLEHPPPPPPPAQPPPPPAINAEITTNSAAIASILESRKRTASVLEAEANDVAERELSMQLANGAAASRARCAVAAFQQPTAPAEKQQRTGFESSAKSSFLSEGSLPLNSFHSGAFLGTLMPGTDRAANGMNSASSPMFRAIGAENEGTDHRNLALLQCLHEANKARQAGKIKSGIEAAAAIASATAGVSTIPTQACSKDKTTGEERHHHQEALLAAKPPNGFSVSANEQPDQQVLHVIASALEAYPSVSSETVTVCLRTILLVLGPSVATNSHTGTHLASSRNVLNRFE